MSCKYVLVGECSAFMASGSGPNGTAIESLFVDLSASGCVPRESTSVATLFTCFGGYGSPLGGTTIRHVSTPRSHPPDVSSDRHECTVPLSVALTSVGCFGG